MSTLDRALRKTLADTIVIAREIAEEASQDAVRRLGVIEDEPPAYLSAEQKALRVRLRAHARALGDGWNSDKKKLLSTRHLETEAAYEIWHRMLFGRFLVERGLLVHPDLGEPIAPSELADLAREEGESDPWALVERFAAPSLPAVFKPDDPVLAMTLDPALARRLRDLVIGLPTKVFTSDDSLGWTYQFWRTSEKDAVNRAGVKVGSDELPAVTQLFTERYMVQFLMHNTLGAWWAGKYIDKNPDIAKNAPDEESMREACALPGVRWEYLRFVRDHDSQPWRPAAGSYPGWPKTAAAITYCDPCCGSGHFLVEAFLILAAMRQQEEGLSAADAVRAVLSDNLHGLELDGRCVQIAAFNVALAAWKKAGSAIALPQPQIAWAGAPPPMSRSEMAALGGGESALQGALERLHTQFECAPLLGSLLETGARDLLDVDLRQRGAAALDRLRAVEPERLEGAIAAQGMLDAASLLGRRYWLLATNVPFLGRGKQDTELANYIARHFPEAKADLATVMMQRMRRMAVPDGVVASVTPQNWLFLGAYRALREEILGSTTLSFVAGLGSRAFETISGEVVNAALVAMQQSRPSNKTTFAALDANAAGDPSKKELTLKLGSIKNLLQSAQRLNPESRITTVEVTSGDRLSEIAETATGIQTFDRPRFVQAMWEQSILAKKWLYLQTSPEENQPYTGCHLIVLWEQGEGRLFHSMERKRIEENYSSGIWKAGSQFWGKKGVLVNLMNEMPSTLYCGYAFDQNVGYVGPKTESDLSAIWTFTTSTEFSRTVREIDRSLKVTNATLGKIPFELAKWQPVAADRYPNGLPEPYSDDPTQWLFHGHPAYAQTGTELHVALARLAGFCWPAEFDKTLHLSPTARARAEVAAALPGVDRDGLLTLHPHAKDRSLADRLRGLLAVAYGSPLELVEEAELVRSADAKLDKKEPRDGSLEAWLRDRAFRQHCILFQHRPFIWQVWDGLRDGFSAFLNYHRLDHATLEKLTFSLLGDWIAKARDEGRTAHENRGLQLQQRLRAILDGEAPYDIFIRWKSLTEQPFGWQPDLDDGVRLNIRPFMRAEVLREQPRINWTKDRGTDVRSAPWFHLGPTFGGNEGDRINDHHLNLAEKRAALDKAKAS